MANATVEYSTRAVDQLEALETADAERIVSKLDDVTWNVEHYLRGRKMTGEPYYSLRVGDYRVIIDWRRDEGPDVLFVRRAPQWRLQVNCCFPVSTTIDVMDISARSREILVLRDRRQRSSSLDELCQEEQRAASNSDCNPESYDERRQCRRIVGHLEFIYFAVIQNGIVGERTQCSTRNRCRLTRFQPIEHRFLRWREISVYDSRISRRRTDVVDLN